MYTAYFTLLQLDSLGHYTVYALEGRGGEVRWHLTPKDFQFNPAYSPVCYYTYMYMYNAIIYMYLYSRKLLRGKLLQISRFEGLLQLYTKSICFKQSMKVF